MVLNEFDSGIVISRNSAILVRILSCIITPNWGTKTYMGFDFPTNEIFDQCGDDIRQLSPLETGANNSMFAKI